MATAASISLEEYLRSDWSPDREYVEGEIQERSSGEYDRATLQDALLGLFCEHRGAWHVKARPELRVQVAPRRYRVPDVTVLRDDHPSGADHCHSTPALHGDSLPGRPLRSHRPEDHRLLQMGARSVWIIDPPAQAGYDCRGGHLSAWQVRSRLTVPDTAIDIDVAALFASLD